MSPRRRLRRLAIALFMLVAVAVAIYLIRALVRSRAYVSTDDAFIEADVVQISPRVASTVARVLVNDNAHVNEGDLLLELDARDFEARLKQARADLTSAIAAHDAAEINERLVTTTSSADVQEAEAAVELSQRRLDAARHMAGEAQAQTAAAAAEADNAVASARRYESLAATGAVSKQESDDARARSRTALAKLEAAKLAEEAAVAEVQQQNAELREARAKLSSAMAAPDQIRYSRAQVEQAKAEIGRMQAAVRQAELSLSYTRLYAPATGRVTRRNVERGDFVQAGQRVLSIVPDSVFVVANFKETQLHRIRPGQPVIIKVDAYPDTTFDGRVQSIQAGSGSAFSLLPPESATGNFVKVTQRVPVKIVVTGTPDSTRVLGPGMSVQPKVKVR